MFKKPAFWSKNMQNTFIDVDQSIMYVGDNSRFQKRILMIFSFQYLFMALFVMGLPILLEIPHFKCKRIEKIDQNRTREYYDSCDQIEVCKLRQQHKYHDYMIQGFKSVVAQLDLICDRAYFQHMISFYFFLGNVLSAFVPDWYGRRATTYYSYFFPAICIALCAFVKNTTIYCILIFTAGVGLGNYDTSCMIYIVEISAIQFKNMSSNVILIAWSLGQFGYSFVFQIFQIHTYFYLLILVAVLMFISLIYMHKYLIETPQYYLFLNRYDDARQVCRAISIFNRRPPFDYRFMEELPIFNELPLKIRHPHSIAKMNALQLQENIDQDFIIISKLKNWGKWWIEFIFDDLMYTHKYRMLTLKVGILWIFRYYIYYTVAFSIQHMGSYMNKNYFILAGLEILAIIISIPLQLRFTRLDAFQKAFLAITLSSISIFLINIDEQCWLHVFVCWGEIFSMILALILQFANMFFIVVLLTYTSEIFPPQMKGSAYGVCCFMGNIGSMFAPLVVNLFGIRSNPLQILFVVGIIGYCISMTLDETFYPPQPENESQQKEKENEPKEMQMKLLG